MEESDAEIQMLKAERDRERMARNAAEVGHIDVLQIIRYIYIVLGLLSICITRRV